jgi:hypothetical protein
MWATRSWRTAGVSSVLQAIETSLDWDLAGERMAVFIGKRKRKVVGFWAQRGPVSHAWEL